MYHGTADTTFFLKVSEKEWSDYKFDEEKFT